MRRPVVWEDLRSLARAALAVDPHRRQQRVHDILMAAGRAMRHVRVTGVCHPVFGDGSIDRAARRYRLAPEPFLDQQDYLGCLMLAAESIERCVVNIQKHPAFS